MSGYGPESEFTSSPLFLSTLGVHVKPQFGKKVKAIRVNAGTIQKEVPRGSSASGSHHKRFDPPLEISLHTKFLVSIYSNRSGAFPSVVSISLDPRTVLNEANAEDGKQVYRKTEKNVEVVVSVQSLPPTTSGFLAYCPRLRVLVMGKCGIGKSSLINKVFHIPGGDVFGTARGKASSDREYNDRFVFHDNYEADRCSLNDARDFIMDRRRMQNIKDQLHAVWLCLEIQCTGGSIVETHVEDFLRDRDRVLGNIPLVVVFTKLDSLVDTLRTQAMQAGQFLSDRALEERTHEALEKHCFGPIRMAMGNNDVVYIAVSTAEYYEDSIFKLVEKTMTNIEKYNKNAKRTNISLTANEGSTSCSRFRVLVIGEARVGKYSLMDKVRIVSSIKGPDTEPEKADINDRVSGVDVSHIRAGQAKIDEEYIARDNGLFIVHDSCGFEAGDQRHLDTLCNFIKNRRHMENLKDQVHAVWLCLEIPFAGGRVLETGVEEFLKQRDQILGNTPLVVVFTKLESLVNMLRVQALQAGQFLDDDALEERKRQELEKHCLKPIQTLLKNNDVSSVAVSTEEGYESSLSELVEKTTTNIQKHIRNEVTHYVAMMAQRVNIALKVAATIAVGEKRYWNMLKESPNFKGLTMKACLDVLHKDIVTVWNFKDPQNSLYEESFKDGLLKTSDLYEASQYIVRQLMAYIVDLTCVMQILFLRVTVRSGEASAEAVSFAMQAYKETNLRRVHDEISRFSVGLGTAHARRDEELDKIKELINKYRIQDGDVAKLRHWL